MTTGGRRSWLPRSGRRTGGFTLMETLVMVMLVSIASVLMFQMLDSYRHAQERVQAFTGAQDRRALFEAWLADSVRGLMVFPSVPFRGDKAGFTGMTLNPVLGSSGTPTQVRWSLDTASAPELVYWEGAKERWRSELAPGTTLRFMYVDGGGKPHPGWPPALGEQEPLPAAVVLVRDDGSATRVIVSAVYGPRQARDLPFELEQE